MKAPNTAEAALSVTRQGVPIIQQCWHPTKEAEVLMAMFIGSLNRFEAERIGDHCLNTTVSILRGKGVIILDTWEKVPSRGARGETNVKRYWVAPEPKNIDRVRALLGAERGGE